MYEEWRDIKNFEGLYQVSNFGRIKSVKRIVKRGTNYKPVAERLLKFGGKDKGSYYVILSKEGITYTKYVHRLVAEAFLPNPNNYPFVHHKDGNRFNHSLSNIELLCPNCHSLTQTYRARNKI